MLQDKIRSYTEYASFGMQTPAMYKKDYPYLREVDSLALANVQLNLQRAMKNCFDRSRKKQNGFPKFKSAKRSRKAYTTNNQHGSIAITSNAVKLPKLGWVKAKIHRRPEQEWKLKSATISQGSDENFYVSILFEYEQTKRYFAQNIHRDSQPVRCCLCRRSELESNGKQRFRKRKSDPG